VSEPAPRRESEPPYSIPPYSIAPTPTRNCVGLVLSGGGVRGAYEAGVVAGIVEVLGKRATDEAPFKVFAGTSVGAINAAYLASNAHHGHLDAEGLTTIYKRLDIRDHLKLSPLSIFPGNRLYRSMQQRLGMKLPERVGPSFIDPTPIETLVKQSADWDGLGLNLASHRVRALVVAALNVGSGRTTLFVQVAPGVHYRESKDPRHVVRREAITPEHVLASAAIPVIFPARRVGQHYYSDGGLRFNTPIAPAIRAGATKLVVISLLSQKKRQVGDEPPMVDYPSVPFLAGKLLNALLLDPVHYDLQVLERLNKLMETVERTLDQRELTQVQRTLIDTRGAPYRRIDTLVFQPTRDIGRVAGAHVKRLLASLDLTQTLRRFLEAKTAEHSSLVEADLASYLLFDGGFAGELCELGRADAVARADEIRRFFV
jgi:NTE family protein